MAKRKKAKANRPEVIRAWVCCHKKESVRDSLIWGGSVRTYRTTKYPNPAFIDRPVRIIVGGNP